MSISGIPQFYIPYGCYEMKKPEAQAIQVLLLMALRHIPVWEEQQWISARSQAPIITGKKKKKSLLFSECTGKVWFTGEVILKECSNSWIRKRKSQQK